MQSVEKSVVSKNEGGGRGMRISGNARKCLGRWRLGVGRRVDFAHRSETVRRPFGDRSKKV